MGKGTFITEQAKRRKDVNFFGIEYAAWYYRYCSDRLRRNHCTNARTARIEAAFCMREHIPDASLSVLHIYFPDPWPKAKQNKRRLIQSAFMALVEQKLVPGGLLKVVTDHKGYFDENMTPFITASRLTVVPYARPESAAEAETVGTNFERKYILEGRPFYSIAAEKRF
jgi:tRNA (guanine-N7-)-methyltransferase